MDGLPVCEPDGESSSLIRSRVHQGLLSQRSRTFCEASGEHGGLKTSVGTYPRIDSKFGLLSAYFEEFYSASTRRIIMGRALEWLASEWLGFAVEARGIRHFTASIIRTFELVDVTVPALNGLQQFIHVLPLPSPSCTFHIECFSGCSRVAQKCGEGVWSW